MVTLTPDHPVVRAAAEEMARDFYATWPDGYTINMSAIPETFARMICDFTRPATRDYWVRWGGARDGEERARHFRAIASTQTPPRGFEADPNGEARARHLATLRWNDLRDNPEALSRAVVDALETK